MSTFGVERWVLNVPANELLPIEERYRGNAATGVAVDAGNMLDTRRLIVENRTNPEFLALIQRFAVALVALQARRK